MIEDYFYELLKVILTEDCRLLVLMFLPCNLHDEQNLILFMVLSMVLVLVLKTPSLAVLDNWDLAQLDGLLP